MSNRGLRIKAFIGLFTTIALLLLTGCAANFYQSPKGQEAAASISGFSKRDSLVTWIKTSVNAIDDQSIGFSFSNTSVIKIYPGTHIITITVDFGKGMFSGGPFTAIADVSASFKANQKYVVKAQYKGSKVHVWLVDSMGKTVSKRSIADYRVKPQPQIIYY